MTRKQESQETITLGEALHAIKTRAQAELMWRVKAAQLLAFVGENEVDQGRLREECKKHAEAANEL